MNPYTGEVCDIDGRPEGFYPLPPSLNRQSRRVMDSGGRVDLNTGTPLALWAATKRRQRAKQRKAANVSRRRNRV